MNLFRQLAEKPWTTPGHHAWAAADGAGGDLRRTAVTGLKLYFAAATVMFGLILAGYLMSGSHGGAHNMPQDWRPLPKNWLLWYNSGIDRKSVVEGKSGFIIVDSGGPRRL